MFKQVTLNCGRNCVFFVIRYPITGFALSVMVFSKSNKTFIVLPRRKKNIFLREPIQSLVHGNKIRGKILNGSSKPRSRHLIPDGKISGNTRSKQPAKTSVSPRSSSLVTEKRMFSQAKKQVNDTNFYSHYISPWAFFFLTI